MEVNSKFHFCIRQPKSSGVMFFNLPSLPVLGCDYCACTAYMRVIMAVLFQCFNETLRPSHYFYEYITD